MSKSEQTKEKILVAAEEVFAQKGYHAAVVDDIAVSSKTSKGAIYFHFPSKEEIFFALMDRFANKVMREIEDAISTESGALAKIDRALDHVLATLAKRRQLAKLLLIHGHGLGPAFEEKRLEIYDRFASLIITNLNEAQNEGSIDQINTTITAHAWLGAISELIIRWLYTGDPDPITQTQPALRDLFLKGIGAKGFSS